MRPINDGGVVYDYVLSTAEAVYVISESLVAEKKTANILSFVADSCQVKLACVIQK